MRPASIDLTLGAPWPSKSSQMDRQRGPARLRMDTHAIYQQWCPQSRVLRISEPRATAVRELMIHPFHHMTDVAYSSIFNPHIDLCPWKAIMIVSRSSPNGMKYHGATLRQCGPCNLRHVTTCLSLLASARRTSSTRTPVWSNLLGPWVKLYTDGFSIRWLPLSLSPFWVLRCSIPSNEVVEKDHLSG
jgi:hypothetical protein